MNGGCWRITGEDCGNRLYLVLEPTVRSWNKGATSGHVQKVVSIDYDCDGDSLLVRLNKRCDCHTEIIPASSYPLWNSGAGRNLPVPEPDGIHGILFELYRVIQDKRVHGGEKLIPVICLCQVRIRF